MKKNLCLFVVFITTSVFAQADKNFDFFKSIPKYESIILYGQEISITIKGDYSVTMYASQNPSYISSKLSGSGTVIWDVESKGIYLQVDGNVTGNYDRTESVYRTERSTNGAAIASNILFGTDYRESSTRRVYDHTEYYTGYGNDSFSEKIPFVVYDDNTYSVGTRTFSVYIRGNCSEYVRYSLNGNMNKMELVKGESSGIHEFSFILYN